MFLCLWFSYDVSTGDSLNRTRGTIMMAESGGIKHLIGDNDEGKAF